jgi:hypothetical protein
MQIMSGFTYAFRIINPLEIIIKLFIRFVLNYGFVKKNLRIKKDCENSHYYDSIRQDHEASIPC